MGGDFLAKDGKKPACETGVGWGPWRTLGQREESFIGTKTNFQVKSLNVRLSIKHS